ncbi:MAG: bifunctional phosphopantothenoylcysteine decarboxylase/phosphopantothenate--cysteine ligase CoaBC [Cyanobacteria bacterium P01_H01_bin.121]
MNTASLATSIWPERRILLGITGGIAAYKICEIASSLAKAGALVRPILTSGAQQFITPLTFSTLCRHAAYTDNEFWSGQQARPLHIELGEWAELILIAPLTANTLGKLAFGLADNLLTNTVLASTCPILLAPAMNTDMWEQPVVQENWNKLRSQPRYQTLTPSAGRLACDRVGQGRLPEPETILAALASLLHTRGQQDLVGQHVLITAGGTREYLDPVRFLGNPSTGRMGLALALAAIHRGATVSLIHGPLADPIPDLEGLEAIAITTAAELQAQLHLQAATADWIIMAAAVADVRPAQTSAVKLAKVDLPPALPLATVPDLIAELAKTRRPQQKLIGFAAQTGDIVTPAIAKLQRKQLDAIVANPIDQPQVGFGSHQNQAIVLQRDGQQTVIPPCSKLSFAHRLFDILQKKLAG